MSEDGEQDARPTVLQYATPKEQVIVAPPWGVPVSWAALPFVSIATAFTLYRWQVWPMLAITAGAIALMSPLLMPGALLATLDCVAAERRDHGQLRPIAKVHVILVGVFLVLDVAAIAIVLL